VSRFLFVHGVYHGPECWEPVIEVLRSRGHEGSALALRGHGDQDRHDFDFKGVGFSDYLDDVRKGLAAAGPESILVGHSLGGLLVRKLIEDERVGGAVLVSMPTPSSLRKATWLLLRRFPRATLLFMLTLRSEALYHHPGIVSQLFWSRPLEALPDQTWLEQVLEFRESRRLLWDVQWLRFAPHHPGTSVLVVGGADDFALPEDGFRATAAFHRAALSIVPAAPHDLMLTHPEELADLLDDFSAGLSNVPRVQR